MENVNVVVITGNLTRDPELRHPDGDTAICKMRVAVNTRRKDAQSGEWYDKPNYFDVVVFGARGESCTTYLHRGRPVAIEGRLDWREWEAKDGSGKRQAVQIIADNVQFLGKRDDAERTEVSDRTGVAGSEFDEVPVGAGAGGTLHTV